MPQPSPAVERVMAVLNFFAEHPQQAFSLTQVIKALRVSRATCHSMLIAMVEGGYLYRNPDKTFILGPTLLALARRAEKHFSPLDVARQEMRLLADELDLVVAAQFVERDEVVVRERAASGRHLRWLPSAGARYPLQPWSTAFMSVSTPAQLEVWLARTKAALSEAEKDDLRRQVAFNHRHGFLAATSRSEHVEVDREGLAGLSRQLGGFITDLRPEASYNVLLVEAQILNEDGLPAFALTIYGFQRPYSGEEIARIGQRLREACGRVTTFLAGRRPPPPGPVRTLAQAGA